MKNKFQTELAAKLATKAADWKPRVRHRATTGAAVVLVLLVGCYVVFGQNGLLAYATKRQQHQRLQHQIHALQQQNEQLRQQIHSLKHDPDTIEREARERLHYVRPDEVIVTIPQGKRGH